MWAYWGLKFQILIFCAVHYFNFLSPPICDPCGHYILVPLSDSVWYMDLVPRRRRVLPTPLLMATADIRGYTSTNTHMTGRDRRGLDWTICGHSLGGIIIIIIIVLVVLFCLSTPLSPNGKHPYNSPPHHNHPIDHVLLLPAYYGKDMTMGYTSPQLNYPLALGSGSLSLLFCCCWK